MAAAVAGDQFGKIEIVTGVHAGALGQTCAHRHLEFCRKKRDLNTLDLGRVAAHHLEASIHGSTVIVCAPVPCQGWIEHLAEPVHDDRLGRLLQDAIVDADVVVRTRSAGSQCPARHQGDLGAGRFDGAALEFVGGNYVVDSEAGGGRQMVGTGATDQSRVWPGLCRGGRALDQG